MITTLLSTYDTTFSADVVSFCPLSFKDGSEIAVCGTYQLDPETGEKKGKLLFFRIHKKTLQMLLSEPTLAIFDLHWQCWGDQILLFTVCVDGEITTYNIFVEEDVLSLKKVTTTIWEPGVSNLFVDTSLVNNHLTLCTSNQNGKLSIWEYSESKDLILRKSWQAHEYETWVVKLFSPSILFSGSDDLFLKCWDTSQENSPVLLSQKKFSMGVTHISFDSSHPNHICVGSYDEFLYLFKVSQKHTLTLVSKIHLFDGVWRIIWKSYHLFIAAMNKGFHVVSLDEKNQFSLLSSFHEPHSSLAYGVDYNNKNLIICCSFYDHLLSLSSFEVNNQQ